MNKDLQTNIAAGVGAAAIIAQYVAGKFGIDLGLTADVLSAITVAAGLYISWKVGKSGNNPEVKP